MFITLKMMQSVDGVIARTDDDKLEWGSKADKLNYKEVTIRYGTVIVGSKTFLAMPKAAFKNRKAIILTRNPERFKEFRPDQGNEEGIRDFTFLPPNPDMVVSYLDSKGVDKAVLIGGGKVNGLFLRAGRVDRICITIAPKVFGTGTRIFGDEALDVKLKINRFEKITEDEMMIVYDVIKDL
jgi:dihydrofolate reductase